jgi:hypothetical protein
MPAISLRRPLKVLESSSPRGREAATTVLVPVTRSSPLTSRPFGMPATSSL